jgi:large subunit ribosomal protein L25
MTQIQELAFESRANKGKGPAYQARQKGLVPAIIYGGADQPQTITVDARSLERAIEKGAFLTTLLMLNEGGKKTRVIPRQVQLDPVSDRPVHVDFLRLAPGSSVRIQIPVRFKGQGESPGLKKGGVLNIVRHKIEMICPADHIPTEIVVDVSKVDIAESIHISAVNLPEGAKPVIRGRDFTVASIVASSSVREEQKAAASGTDAPAAEAAPAAAAAAPAAGAKAPAAGAKAAPAAAAKPAAKK